METFGPGTLSSCDMVVSILDFKTKKKLSSKLDK